MNNKPVNIGILLLPSVRSLAYCYIFQQLGICPKEVILLEGSWGLPEGLIHENEKYNYNNFFNLLFDPIRFLKTGNADIFDVHTYDINSNQVHEVLKTTTCDYFIFTGGGILSKQTLDLHTGFIHVHPGNVPDYRGSTCFYYSLLEKDNVGSSAIVMDEKIDTGDLIASSKFVVNYFINADQQMFIDYILDPYIRSYTLGKVLKKYIEGEKIKGESQTRNQKSAYYIIHPFLRHLTIDKINRNYNAKKKTGIFEII